MKSNNGPGVFKLLIFKTQNQIIIGLISHLNKTRNTNFFCFSFLDAYQKWLFVFISLHSLPAVTTRERSLEPGQRSNYSRERKCLAETTSRQLWQEAQACRQSGHQICPEFESNISCQGQGPNHWVEFFFGPRMDRSSSVVE